jgi:cytochrome c peroxidase
VIAVPTVPAAEATGATGALVAYVEPSATDIVDPAVLTSCSAAPGDLFPLATTTVSCSATDAAGNTGSASFDITVADTTAPVIAVPTVPTAEATGATGALVAYTVPSATDVVDPAVLTSCSAAPGDLFPLATTPVACSATDAAGNTGNASFDITVADTTAPVISGTPADITTEAVDGNGSPVAYLNPTSLDIVDGGLAVACIPATDSTFALGNTTVACSVSDLANNSTNTSFVVTVIDTTAPVISGVPANIVSEADSGIGAIVTYADPTALDAVVGPVAVSCTPASGANFPLGMTTVTCSTADTVGTIASASFNVTVEDTTAPVLTLPAHILAEAIADFTPVDIGTATATDHYPVTLSNNAPASFARGVTLVTWTATDDNGNSSTAGQQVVLNTAPIAGAGGDITILLASAGVPLAGSGSDDGLPSIPGVLSFLWEQVDGPAGGITTFFDPTVPLTTATFSTPGPYTLRLTASDGNLFSFDLVLVDFANALVGLLPAPLDTVPVPRPDGLAAFIPPANEAAAIQLGKALFWDMQVGSDGQACASCHFHAGADHRKKNQASPGFLGGATGTSITFELGGAPNYTLQPGDFPTHKLFDHRNALTVASDVDDVVSSMGVPRFIFQDIVPGSSLDLGYPKIDPDGFAVGGVNVRRVEPRNTPTTINAVFNLRNFWDGRARHFFNGVNPFGVLGVDPLTTFDKVLVVDTAGAVADHPVELNFSSLASQAVGPPGSPFEMSFDGRSFPKIGKKVLGLTPLGEQFVAVDDSVLGAFANTAAPGLTTTYAQMVQNSFDPKFWNSTKLFRINMLLNGGNGGWEEVPALEIIPGSTDQFTLMEVNFSLIFGLAVQMYEATQVSDQSRFDDFLRETAAIGSSAALTPQEKTGLDVFFGGGLCFNCHGGPELTLASVTAVGLVDAPGAVPEAPIETMFAAFGQGLASVVFADFVNPAGFLALNFDPRGKQFEILDSVGSPIFSGLFPGTPAACSPGAAFAFLLNPVPLVPLVGPQLGDAAVEYAELDNGVGGCQRLLTIALIEHALPTVPPTLTFVPVGNYILTVSNADPVAPLVLASAPMEVIDPILYDLGFYNIGVRPTAEDIGLAGLGPFGDPLSIAVLAQGGGGGSGFPLPAGFDPTRLAAIQGTFKVPGLRNVELTGPYFHNGGQATLRQVVEFYNRGGDFGSGNLEFLDPDITQLFLTDAEIDAVVAFLKTLTDERVRNEQAPFDHPQLFVSNGAVGNQLAITAIDATVPQIDLDTAGLVQTGLDEILVVPMVGAGGRPAVDLPPLGSFEQLLNTP